MKMNLAVEPGTETTKFGVVVPDLPGCFSAGDTLDEAVHNARAAIELWCQKLIKDGGVPVAKTLAELQANPDFAGWIWAAVEVDEDGFAFVQYNCPMMAAKNERRNAFIAQVERGEAKATDAYSGFAELARESKVVDWGGFDREY